MTDRTVASGRPSTFAGIAPADVGMFLVAQVIGAPAGLAVMSWLFAEPPYSVNRPTIAQTD